MQPLCSALPEESCTDGIGGVALVAVMLEDQSTVEGWLMLVVMLIRVVRVQGMGHVSTDKEALA